MVFLYVLIFSIAEKPGITKEDLQKHNAIQEIEPQFEKLGLDESNWENSTENTVGTFATNYSNCSNISFTRYVVDCI